MNSRLFKKAAALGLTAAMVMSFAACTAKTEHKETEETSETLRESHSILSDRIHSDRDHSTSGCGSKQAVMVWKAGKCLPE